MIKGFQDLVVWQKAHKLALEICKLTNLFPRHEHLTSRLRRAASLILSNLAERYRGPSTKELQSLTVANGLAEELLYFLTFASDLRYFPPQDQDRLKRESASIVQMIAALARSVTERVNSCVSGPILVNAGYRTLTSGEGRMT